MRFFDVVFKRYAQSKLGRKFAYEGGSTSLLEGV